MDNKVYYITELGYKMLLDYVSTHDTKSVTTDDGLQDTGNLVQFLFSNRGMFTRDSASNAYAKVRRGAIENLYQAAVDFDQISHILLHFMGSYAANGLVDDAKKKAKLVVHCASEAMCHCTAVSTKVTEKPIDEAALWESIRKACGRSD